MVIQHPVKFNGHRHSVSVYITVLAWHVILQNHLIKGSIDFMGEPLTVSQHPSKFGGLWYCGTVDIMFLAVEE